MDDFAILENTSPRERGCIQLISWKFIPLNLACKDNRMSNDVSWTANCMLVFLPTKDSTHCLALLQVQEQNVPVNSPAEVIGWKETLRTTGSLWHMVG